MKKISPFQFVSLLLASRLFVTMTYSPSAAESSLTTIIGGSVSMLMQAIALLAPLAIAHKYGDRNVVELGYRLGKPTGILLSLIYSAFLIWTAARVMRDFSEFITFAFPVFTAKTAIIVFMAAAAVYIASMGIEATARSSVVILALLIAMISFVLLGTSGEIDVHNLSISVESPVSDILTSAVYSFGRNSELILICMILPCLRSRQRTASYSYLGIKYLAASLIAFLYTSILGSFAYSAPLPFFHLSSYSNTAVVARFDPLFLIVWTLCAVIKLSAMLWAAGRCVGYMLPKAKPIYILPAMGALSLLAFLPSKGTASPQSPSLALFAAAVTAFLCIIPPAAVLLIPKTKTTNKREENK